MEEKILIAICDSLRKEGTQNIYLEGCNYLGQYFSEPIYNLHSLNKEYMALTENGDTSILFEIYEVDSCDIMNLDYFYGMGVIGYLLNYYKKTIETSYGKCLTYFSNKNINNKPKIDSGDYIDWKKEIKKLITKTEELSSRHGFE